VDHYDSNNPWLFICTIPAEDVMLGADDLTAAAVLHCTVQPLRAAALKQLEESRKAAEDGQAADQHSASGAAADASNVKDTTQAPSAGARVSTISSSQAVTLAAAPADVVHSSPARRASEAGGRSAAAAAAAAAAEKEREKQLEREEKRYRELEAQFKEQLGLA
jgi:hypothetical protein